MNALSQRRIQAILRLKYMHFHLGLMYENVSKSLYTLQDFNGSLMCLTYVGTQALLA